MVYCSVAEDESRCGTWKTGRQMGEMGEAIAITRVYV